MFGALLVFLAMLVVFWLPHSGPHGRLKRSSQTAAASAYECGPLLLPASSVLEEGSVTPPCVTASSPRFRTSTDSLDEFSSAEYRFGGTFSS